MKKRKIEIRTNVGSISIDAFSEKAADLFVTHQRFPHGEDWVITHIVAGLAIPRFSAKSRSRALEIAGRLSRECPAAKDIPKDAEGVKLPILGKQVKAILAEMGEEA